MLTTAPIRVNIQIMNIASIILSAAKSFGVSGTLLLAICNHESAGFTKNHADHDKGSPSYGSCQIKFSSAQQMGFKGNPDLLDQPKVNARYAAKYLQWQQTRYGDRDWLLLAAAYNAGSYKPSRKVRGCPMNLGYIKLVQAKLPSEYQSKLDCGHLTVANK